MNDKGHLQSNAQPLAEQLRPRQAEAYLGQQHLMGQGSAFRQMMDEGRLHSMIFWGPPGSGKTTLALLAAEKSGRKVFTLSAVHSGVKEVREVIAKANLERNQPVLFIDEIHRFSKSQQDSLLGAVEKGTVILIGATTENPSFEVIAPLLSRCQVYVLNPLSKPELHSIAMNALNTLNQQSNKQLRIVEEEALMRISGGDARKLLNALEIVHSALYRSGGTEINNENTLQIIQRNIVLYDKSGEMHYDIISAFIKSMRGSDPNATVYWLARMIQAGEDPLFIARRMVILAAEDIGVANPTALVLANSCFEAVNKTGYPECRILLAEAAVYLACSPKSNASYMALEKALAMVQQSGDLPVPLSIRNAPTKLMKDLGYGSDYQYAHEHRDNFAHMEFLPDAIKGTKLYDPGLNARENEFRGHLKKLWKEKYDY